MDTQNPELVRVEYIKNMFAADARPSNLQIWRWIKAGALPAPVKMVDRVGRDGRRVGRNFWRRSEVDATFRKPSQAVNQAAAA
jgi:hypothetical protein